MMPPTLPPGAVTAEYIPQRIPAYRGNPLIEALPPAWSEEEWADYLMDLPEISDESRSWPQHERLSMIEQLSSFMRPLTRHIRLALAIDSIIRNGYVGRLPDSPEFHALKQEIYSAGQRKESVLKTKKKGQSGAAFTSSLIGLSGQGKTTLTKMVCGRYPVAIYHPLYHTYQVPTIYVDAPFGGTSVKSLAVSIITALDRAVPGSDYYGRYAAPNRRASAESLINTCAMLLHTHHVGLLVIDELQFLLNGGSDTGTLLSALVSASNVLGVPIFLVGTPKAQRILTGELHSGRRGVGHGSTQWWALSRSGSLDDPDEWEDFLSTLWEYQYIENPVPLTNAFSQVMFERTSGIVDLTIKLFAAIQWSAILDRRETITAALIREVWETDFKCVHGWTQAVRNGEFERLDGFESERLKIVALDLQSMGQSKRAPRAKTLPPEVANASQQGKPKVRSSTSAQPSNLRETETAGAEASENTGTAYGRGVDYREALGSSGVPGVNVLERLGNMGALANVDDLLNLG